MHDGVEVEVVAGPDVWAGGRIGVGRHVVGRDPTCDLRVLDPSVARAHALIEVRGRSGGVHLTVTALVGTRRVVLDGRPVTSSRRRDLGPGDTAVLAVGSSLLRCGVGSAASSLGVPTSGVASPAFTDAADGTGRRILHRRLQLDPPPPSRSIRLPEEPPVVGGPPATTPVMAVVGLLASSIVALVTGHAMFLVIAAAGAVAAGAGWAGGWARTVRRRRADRRDWDDALDRLDADLGDAADEARSAAWRGCHLTDLLRVARDGLDGSGGVGASLWSSHHRTSGSPDDGPRSIGVTVGRGDVEWDLPIETPHTPAPTCARLSRRLDRRRVLGDVPVTVTVTAGRTVTICGSGRTNRDGIARSVVAQLAWSVGPGDLRLVVCTDRPAAWAWPGALPHVGEPAIVDLRNDDAVRVLAELVDVERPSTSPLSVLVVDTSSELDVPDGPVRGHLGRPGLAVVVVADEAGAWADEAVVVGESGTLRHVCPGGSTVVSAQAVGISAATASALALALASIIDPDLERGSAVPVRCDFTEVQFGDLLGRRPSPGERAAVTAEAVLGWWAEGGEDPPPAARIGRHASGVEVVDLVADGPHALLAGTTGSGKSELLRTLVLGLAVRSRPEQLGFVLIDFKGGSAFDACAGLPHVLGVVTDLDEGLAERALVGLDAELRRRQTRFREVGVGDLTAWRTTIARGEATDESPLPRLVVIVDEFATLAVELPEFLRSLVDIAQRGRSLGVHLVLATQRPAGVLTDDIRANTALRLALRTQSAADSSDVVGVGDAATIPRSVPGRALRSTEDGLVREFQCARTADAAGAPDGELRSVDRVVDAVRQAHRRSGPSAVRRLWCPPLPHPIAASELADELVVRTPVEEIDGPTAASPVGDSGAPVLGVIDDPAGQRRRPLRWEPGDGSLLVAGSPGAGVTSTLLAIGAAACATLPPDHLQLAVIDAVGDGRFDAMDGVAHCIAVVRPAETERLRRLLERLDRADDGVRTLVVIDGLDVLRQRLLAPDGDAELAGTLRSVVAHGADRSVEIVASTRSDLAASGFVPVDTWVGSLDDPLTVRALGWRAPPVPARRPGRFGLVGSGLVAQVALGAPHLAELPMRSGRFDPPVQIEQLPLRVALDEVEDWAPPGLMDERVGARLTIGLEAATLRPDGPVVDGGAHLLVVGRPGSGVSTALRAVAVAWERSGRGQVVWVHADEDLADVADAASRPAHARALVVVDDAHRIADGAGVLTSLLDRPGDLTVVAGVRLDAFRAAYGHWTRTLAAAEHGLALAASGEPPTDVFGVAPPRRPIVDQRPGLGWLVERGRVRGLQVAEVSDG